MDWKPTRFEKITIKVLYEDAGKGEMTCLLKLEPGAHVPFHKHPEIEQSFVLEGSVEDHDGVARAGDYIWRKPGSLHENWSPNGAVLLAVYRKPNIYYDAGRETAGF
ncbi:MAG: cupin domain-containing protein [Alphaproteobacteria bacterium]|nr:cupin domain-containing protein [Alphaproteobacteria bacterium]